MTATRKLQFRQFFKVDEESVYQYLRMENTKLFKINVSLMTFFLHLKVNRSNKLHSYFLKVKKFSKLYPKQHRYFKFSLQDIKFFRMPPRSSKTFPSYMANIFYFPYNYIFLSNCVHNTNKQTNKQFTPFHSCICTFSML